MPNALSKAPATAGRPEDDIGPLPEGWEERVHSDGRIFYIDHSEWIVKVLFIWQTPSIVLLKCMID